MQKIIKIQLTDLFQKLKKKKKKNWTPCSLETPIQSISQKNHLGLF